MIISLLKSFRNLLFPRSRVSFLDVLKSIRTSELTQALSFVNVSSSSILDFGAGTGISSALLSKVSKSTIAVDIKSSNYSNETCFPVLIYDGKVLPFEDHTFDIIFSSNVLEHIPDLSLCFSELSRVSTKSSLHIHVLPSHMWRFWTSFTSFIYSLRFHTINQVHGVHSSNVLQEFLFFHPSSFINQFETHGYIVLSVKPTRLFYTGNSLLGKSLSIRLRTILSFFLGSSTYIYYLVKSPD